VRVKIGHQPPPELPYDDRLVRVQLELELYPEDDDQERRGGHGSASLAPGLIIEAVAPGGTQSGGGRVMV
jgi:hypothetical protein